MTDPVVVTYELGKDAVCTIDGTECSAVSNVSLTLSAGTADVTTRNCNGWKQTIPTLNEASAEITIVARSDDSGVSTLMTHYLAFETLPISIMSTIGISGDWSVTNISREETMEDAIKYTFSVALAKFTSWS